MTLWVAMNIASALLVAGMCMFLIAAFRDLLSQAEGFTVTMLGASMVLRIGPMLAKNVLETVSPYDDWSVSLLHGSLVSAGILIIRRIDIAYRKGTMFRP